jgi:hypothetical protein
MMEQNVLRWKPKMAAQVFDPRTTELFLQLMGLQLGTR